MLTAKELISALQQCDPTAVVNYWDGSGICRVVYNDIKKLICLDSAEVINDSVDTEAGWKVIDTSTEKNLTKEKEYENYYLDS